MSPNASASNYGAGSQNVHVGNGHQSNNNGSGIQHNYYGDPPKDSQADEAERIRNEKEACLRSLSFPNIHARHEDIATAHADTCNWLFKTTEFREWRDSINPSTHNRVLWIKGKPGAGKSTLMKHTLRHCEEVFKGHLIIAYFFNARGEILEKTPQGMLRSIVYQLLDGDTTLHEQFVPIYNKQNRHKQSDWEWRQTQLKEFVRWVIKHWKLKPLLLLVDALDECDEQDVRDVVDFLESLSINAIKAGTKLRICLSSRHYPNISMKKALELAVEKNEEHRGDIAAYVGEKLKAQNNYIKAEIVKKADGIFMWVVIIVSLLNKYHDEGRPEVMWKTLEEVPGDLEEVFNILLSKDDRDRPETILVL